MARKTLTHVDAAGRPAMVDVSGKASTAQVGGQVKNLLGQITPLTFKQVTESGAIYYLAQFPFAEREVLSFTLEVQQGGNPHSFSFNQEMFPDE